MQNKSHYIVVGSGLAGSTFIAAMASKAEKITLLERCLPDAVIGSKDQRPISLSYSTVIMLRNLGVWDKLAKHAGAIDCVHVSEQNRFGSLTLKASDAELHALGYVVPFHLLSEALYECAMSQSNVECISVTDITAINETDGVCVTYASNDGECDIRGDYLIAADGMNSRCRELLDIKVKESSHNDMALTAMLTLAGSHNGVAYERFTKQGVLALLPMWDRHQYRLVWTIDKARFDELTDEALLRVVGDTFGSRVGAIKNLSRMGDYPLKTSSASKQITEHCVLLGDSAHRIYPLAAQGYNLTVRDCAMLVDILSAGGSLEEYAKLRRSDQKFISCFTQGLEWVFGLQLPLLDHLRSTALLKMDLLVPLKKKLILKILGRGSKQPELLCEE
jgi:2-octaprenyl-6-methoxyphenol hydroxylase